MHSDRVEETLDHHYSIAGASRGTMIIEQHCRFAESGRESIARILTGNRSATIGHQTALVVMDRNHHPAAQDAGTAIVANAEVGGGLPAQAATGDVAMGLIQTGQTKTKGWVCLYFF